METAIETGNPAAGRHYASRQRASGSGRLGLKCDPAGITRIDSLYQEGCARIRMPRARGAEIEAVLINTSGGLTGGDRLDWQVVADSHTKTLVTTQACEKVYKSDSGAAVTAARISAGNGASVAWLPQESILFDRSALHRSLVADLAENVRFLCVESFVFGRHAMGEVPESLSVRDRWRISQNGKLLHAEDFRFEGETGQLLHRQAAMAGCGAISTVLLISPESEGFVFEAREIVGEAGGVSCWNGKFLARLAAKDSYELRRRLVPLLALLNGGAGLPKVWSL